MLTGPTYARYLDLVLRHVDLRVAHENESLLSLPARILAFAALRSQYDFAELPIPMDLRLFLQFKVVLFEDCYLVLHNLCQVRGVAGTHGSRLVLSGNH